MYIDSPSKMNKEMKPLLLKLELELEGRTHEYRIQQNSDEQSKTKALRVAFFEGENSGEPEPWDINQIIAEAKQEKDLPPATP